MLRIECPTDGLAKAAPGRGWLAACALLALALVSFHPCLGGEPGKLIGFPTTEPVIGFDGAGTLSYDANSDTLSVDGTPDGIVLTEGGAPAFIDEPTALTIRIKIDDAGTLTGGVDGDDLVVTGTVDIDTNGDGTPEHYDGVLLRGEIQVYGWQIKPEAFDFIFTTTGGLLQGIFGQKIGVQLGSENCSFTGVFTESFSGGAKGNVCRPGPPPTLPPKIEIEKTGAKVCGNTRTIGFWKNNIRKHLSCSSWGTQVSKADLISWLRAVQTFYLPDPFQLGTTDTQILRNAYSILSYSGSDIVRKTKRQLLACELNLLSGTFAMADASWQEALCKQTEDALNTPGAGLSLLHDLLDTVNNVGEASGSGTICVGDLIVYTITIRSTSQQPLGIEVRDCLDSCLSFLAADHGGFFVTSGHYVQWNLTLPAGENVTTVLHVWARVTSLPVGDNLDCPGPGWTCSNWVDLTVCSSCSQTPTTYPCCPNSGTSSCCCPPLPPPECRTWTCSNWADPTVCSYCSQTPTTSHCCPNSGTSSCCCCPPPPPPPPECRTLKNRACFRTGPPTQEPASIGDKVWSDANANGIQDAGELGIPNVTVELHKWSDDSLVATTTTNANGIYGFSNLTPGDYYVKFVLPSGYLFSPKNAPGSTPANDSDADTGTGRTGQITLTSGQTDLTWDAGMHIVQPAISLAKSAGEAVINPGGQVTYTYKVTNPGAVPLSNVQLTDDNGTPDFAADDFTPTFVGGDTNGNGLLDPGEVWTYTATVIPPVTVCDVINSQPMQVGALITRILPSGDVKTTYIQSLSLNDNSYGTYRVGWGSKTHTFSNLTGSDQAQFVFTNGAGQTALSFKLDYLTPTTSVPSGYKSLGVSGGDGGMLIGSASNVLSYDTSLSRDFNSAGLGVAKGIASNGFNLTQNSPQTTNSTSYTVVDPFFSNWEFRSIYEVTVSKAAFGALGFGSVSVPSVHNSPPKVGCSNETTPEPCDSSVTNRARVTATYGGQTVTATADATVRITTSPLSSVGDTVWFDANANGVQDAGESGIANVTLQLKDNAGQVIATTTTDSNGIYHFRGLLAGTYTVSVAAPAGLTPTFDLDGTSTPNAATFTLAAGQNREDVDFGYVRALPGLTLAKVADKLLVEPGEKVTYTYTAANTSGVPLSSVTITDDNGTPDLTGDDFRPAFAGGDTNSNGLLDPGEVWTYQATRTLPLTMYMIVNGQNTAVGTLIPRVLDSGDVEVTYRQSRNVVDNTYGANAVGYPSGHTFSNLTGSDKAEFRFTNGAGQVVLDFYADYISSSCKYPSGYGTLGVSGGEGKMVIGSAANVLSVKTTITDDLNQSSAFYGYTTNSPAPESAFPTWDYVDGYTVVVSKAAFGSSGFGAVTVPSVHNSPSKLGFNEIKPTPSDSCVTNRAVVVAKVGNDQVAVAAEETVCIITNPGSVGDTVWFDANANGVQDAGEPGIASVTLQLKDSDDQAIATTTTDNNGTYHFTGLPAGTYTVTVAAPVGLVPTFDLDGTSTPNAAAFTLAAGQNREDVDFGYVRTLAGLTLTKVADKRFVEPGEKVVYTYTVKNTSTGTLTNITITDDNGTPAYTADDFVVGTVASLAPGGSKTFLVTRALPLSMCMVVNGQKMEVGTLIARVLDSGDVEVTYRQSRNVVDNTYGKNAVGYGGGHKFTDLVGSDKAEFRFTNGAGQVVLDFYADYISSSCKYPSGYGTLGVSGGDGKMLVGSAGNVLSVKTTITDDLNQSPAFYGYTTNSPAPESAFPTWDYVDGYTVVVSKAAFGSSVFGGVTIPLVHNSPSKLGFNAIKPTACDSSVTNQAVAVATAPDGTPVVATAEATVSITSGSIGGTVWFDKNLDGFQDSCVEPGLGNVTVSLKDSADQVIATTTTDSNGTYRFTGLPAGTYTVVVDVTTVPLGLPEETYDLDGIGTLHKAKLTLSAGQNRTDVDFGYAGIPQ